MPLASLADVGATGCNNAGGPDIAVGKRDQGAMKGRVWFSNQNSVDPAHRTAGTDAYGSMSMSMSASVKKGGAHAGVTGNPYVYYLGSAAAANLNPTSSPWGYLGHCNQGGSGGASVPLSNWSADWTAVNTGSPSKKGACFSTSTSTHSPWQSKPF